MNDYIVRRSILKDAIKVAYLPALKESLINELNALEKKNELTRSYQRTLEILKNEKTFKKDSFFKTFLEINRKLWKFI